MRIGELAKRSGLSRDTIRFYERQGLIESFPSSTSKNTYRNYPDDLVETLAMIGEARDSGMPIADLKTLLDAMQGASETPLDVVDFLDKRISQIEETILNAERFLKVLHQTKNALAAPITDEEIQKAAQSDNNLA